MLSGHGSYELSFDEDTAIFKCIFAGTWNVETVILLSKEIAGYKLPARWAALGSFDDFGGMVPEAYELYNTIMAGSVDKGLCANALVLTNSNLGAELFLDYYLEQRRNNFNIYVERFANEEDARKCLIEIIKS